MGKKETKTMTRSAKENRQTLRPTSKAYALEEVGESNRTLHPRKLHRAWPSLPRAVTLKMAIFGTDLAWEKQ